MENATLTILRVSGRVPILPSLSSGQNFKHTMMGVKQRLKCKLLTAARKWTAMVVFLPACRTMADF